MYLYIHIYIYIYIYTYIYTCLSVYLYIGQSFKEVNLADIKNCLNLVVKVESFKSITSRQNIYHCSWCFHMVKNTGKKLLGTIIPMEKCIQLRVYSPYVKNVWISSLTLFLYFDEVTKILFLVLKIFWKEKLYFTKP